MALCGRNAEFSNVTAVLQVSLCFKPQWSLLYAPPFAVSTHFRFAHRMRLCFYTILRTQKNCYARQLCRLVFVIREAVCFLWDRSWFKYDVTDVGLVTVRFWLHGQPYRRPRAIVSVRVVRTVSRKSPFIHTLIHSYELLSCLFISTAAATEAAVSVKQNHS